MNRRELPQLLAFGHRRRLQRARHLLLEIYERFEDGLDTLDLREARKLLGDIRPEARA
jgi:hypothetical protein